MKGKYFVHHSASGGSWATYHDVLTEAIEKAKAARDRNIFVAIYGTDGYDCDCEDGRFYVCNDGLTEDEREQVAEAL